MIGIGNIFPRAVRVPFALAALWAGDLAWAASAGMSIFQLGVLTMTLLVLSANLLFYRRIRGGERAHELALGFAVFIAIGDGFAVLSYLALTLHMNLADRWLDSADRAFGFDWMGWYGFVRGHTLFNRFLLFAYRSLGPQMVVTLFALPLSGMFARNREYLGATALALLLTVAISALLPAESAWVWHGISEPIAPGPWQDFAAMRAGQLTVLDLAQLRGIVTFPSFHASMAVLLAWAARGTRCGWFSLMLNALMIVSTPTEGGHYMVDSLAGVVVAVVAIGGTRWLTRTFGGGSGANGAQRGVDQDGRRCAFRIG